MDPILGLTWQNWIVGILGIVLSVVVAYVFVYQIIDKLREYLNRYLGDSKLTDGLLKLIGLSVIISALQIGFSAVSINYVSGIVNPALNVAVVAIGFLRWGVLIAVAIFVGFAIHHHARATKGKA